MPLKLPDRVSGLISKIEAGEIPTTEDVRRISLLQALDLVKHGNDFVQEALDRERQAIEQFKGVVNG